MTFSCSFPFQPFSYKCSVVSRSLIEILLCLSIQKSIHDIIHHRHGISASSHTLRIAPSSYVLTPSITLYCTVFFFFFVHIHSFFSYCHYPILDPVPASGSLTDLFRHSTTTTLSVLYCLDPTFSLSRSGGVGLGWGRGALVEAVMLEHGPAVWAAEHLEALWALLCLME